MNNSNIRFLLLGILFIPMFAFGFEKSDITMVSYIQSWKDKKGSLVVKNNTSTKIEHIVFVINYSDTTGNVIKSERYSRGISIAPNGNATIKIPVFEENKYRNKFKIQDEYGRTAFKVGFELIEYNNNDHNDDSDEVFSIVIVLGFVGFGGVILIWYIGTLGDISNYGNNNRL